MTVLESTERANVHKKLLQFEKRAENKSDDVITQTFVDSAPLLDLLTAPLSQIVFGRRGTGKTHAIKYCVSKVRSEDGVALFLDIRSLGSNGSVYGDTSLSVTERSMRLVVDILQALFDELYEVAIRKLDTAPHPDQITLRIDDLSRAISEVKIVGTSEITRVITTNKTDEANANANIELSPKAAGLNLGVGRGVAHGVTESLKKVDQGNERPSLSFGSVRSSLNSLLEIMDVERVWLFLDEWSETPQDVQPYLADMIRKTLLPTGKFIIKIAAIEHRSNFISGDNRDYIGLELGADISADLNLDDFLVFDNDKDKSVSFFSELVLQNYNSLASQDEKFASGDKLIGDIFTQRNVFEEFVKAVEGVPRDALNLVSKIATKGYGKPFGMDHVRSAALDWYQQDKMSVVRSNAELEKILTLIIDDVIGKRKARAFLFPANTRNWVIDRLFDSRIIHLIKKNVSSKDEPGKRYDVWKIDYGCYVDLIRTQQNPQGLLPADEEGTFLEEVPTDDYRSIRRAILTPEKIEEYVNHID